MRNSTFRLAAMVLLLVHVALAAGPDNVLIIANKRSALSRTIAEYYLRRRHIPAAQLCLLDTSTDEEISRDEYNRAIAGPIAKFLSEKNLSEQILYFVTTAGVPLRIDGTGGVQAEIAAVDSELTLLYVDMRAGHHKLPGAIPNPFFGKKAGPLTHPQMPLYFVTRLAGYDFADVRGLIDRSLLAKNTGKFVIDLKGVDGTPGNEWLKDAAIAIPENRVVVDQTAKVLTGIKDVIGFASWGSNDPDRKQRDLHFQWLPGAIMTEYVSTNARTFARPPDSWQIGTWKDKSTWFANSPQTMTADYIHQGVTGAAGHVSEPYLELNPRPDILLPAYYSGQNLADSFYRSLPGLSWMNVIIGDPLCSLGKP